MQQAVLRKQMTSSCPGIEQFSTHSGELQETSHRVVHLGPPLLRPARPYHVDRAQLCATAFPFQSLPQRRARGRTPIGAIGVPNDRRTGMLPLLNTSIQLSTNTVAFGQCMPIPPGTPLRSGRQRSLCSLVVRFYGLG
jgi:hypothetical protein